jgi:sortase (surface protein transpeptidase)
MITRVRKMYYREAVSFPSSPSGIESRSHRVIGTRNMSQRSSMFLVSALLFLTVLAIPAIVTGVRDGQEAPTQPPVVISTITPEAERQATSSVIATTQPEVRSSLPAIGTDVSRAMTESPAINPPSTAATHTPIIEATPPSLAPVVEAPLYLRIPALGVDASVEWVSVDNEGRMDVPTNYDDVAWYERGPRPGMPGNAVIAGHLDSASGPAVFYRLENLQPGDEVFVTTYSGDELRFVVVRTEAFDANDAPLERIFGSGFAPHLNLITCEGNFSRSSGQYDQRLVVFTVLAG